MPKFGPTGEFPEGKIDESDEGAIQIGITHDKENVIIDFGTPVKWVGFPADIAIELANNILQHANMLKKH